MKTWIICLLVIVAGITASNHSYAQAATTQQTTDNLKTTTIKVKGVTCASDLKTIAANVEKLRGVSSCKAGKAGATTSFDITYNPALVTEKEIVAAIEGTGGCENPNARPYKIKQ